ncbi:MAG: tetratricopeptide repeat protein [Gemmatimonadota bacterium]
MSDQGGSMGALEARLRELEARLGTETGPPAAREAVRDQIVQLFRDIEAGIARLETLKEGVRPLVERYHELYPRQTSATTVPRLDHLGSSTYRERGWSALAAGEHESAIEALRRALELDPEDLGTAALLAWAYVRMENGRSARPLLDVALARDSEHPLARVVLGFLHMQEKRYTEAVEQLTAVAGQGTDRTATLYAYLYLGATHVERGMHRQAQNFFRLALELGPNLTEAYWELGRSHHMEGRPDLAIEAWRAGGENRFNPWGERCREAVARLEAGEAAAPS